MTIWKIFPLLITGHHKDPADRWIVAITISEGATLVSLDKKILEFKKVKTVIARLKEVTAQSE